jgi:hypothetical protein
MNKVLCIVPVFGLAMFVVGCTAATDSPEETGDDAGDTAGALTTVPGDTDLDEPATGDVIVKEVPRKASFTGAPTVQSAARRYGEDWETHWCGLYQFDTIIDFYADSKGAVTYSAMVQFSTGFHKGIEYNISVHAGGKTQYSTGTHTTGNYTVYVEFPARHFTKSQHPYVRFSVGKTGDGVGRCAWRVYPLEAG